MRFQFATVSEQDIQSSRGGDDMLQAIRFEGPRDQLITGRPGSGKTTVTIMRARHLTALGKQVIFFTKHNLLVYSLKNTYPRLNIHGIYSWFTRHTSGDYLSEYNDGPTLRAKVTSPDFQYAEVLVDEGQDLPGYMYEALPHMGTRFSVGADTAQRVYTDGADAATIENILKKQGRTIRPVELQYNYRNFVETYDFARQFVPQVDAANSALILANTTKGKGGADILPRVIQVANKIDRLYNLVQDNITTNMAIVLFHVDDAVAYHKALQAKGVECSLYHHELSTEAKKAVAADMQSVLVTTYMSVKGLEFPVVIMPEMEHAPFEEYPSHFYVGCTRATERLFLLYQGSVLPSCLKDFNKASYRHISLSDSQYQTSTVKLPQLGKDEEAPF